jgi:hypothetical protein
MPAPVPIAPPKNAHPFGPPQALNKYPKAPVTAPLANLPPPATEPTPPSTALATRRPPKFKSVSAGPAAAPSPPESAPEPQLPPEATDEPQPTNAWPPTLAAKLPALKSGLSKAGLACAGPKVRSPTPKNAAAVAPATAPALNIYIWPRLPPESPVAGNSR